MAALRSIHQTLANILDFNGATQTHQALHPSSVQRWVETCDPAIKQRILDYNEDDCLATGVVVDGVRNLPVRLRGISRLGFFQQS